MKRVLMIAYHFPPIQGSSGVHRTVQFAKHLPKFGWEPIIVTVHPRAYPSIGNDMLGGLPESLRIKRAQAFDSARHLSIRKAYMSLSAVPDRWVTWWPHGVFSCLELIKKYKPSVIWSTFPIASAHLIALTVQRLTKLPWIADFRDPIIQETQPKPGVVRKTYQWIEQQVIRHSLASVFVTRSAMNHYARKYPGKGKSYWNLIENGYDESLFRDFDTYREPDFSKGKNKPIRLIHSGVLYSHGRNPISFLKGLSAYLKSGGYPVEVTLRGAGTEMDIQNWVNEMNLQAAVKIKPPIPYDCAIKEMLNAHALILFQGPEFNKQIPAKAYEYIRAGHPILNLTHRQGETAGFMKNWDGAYFSDIDSVPEIEKALTWLVKDIRAGKEPVREPDVVKAFSREFGTKKLVRVLNGLFER